MTEELLPADSLRQVLLLLGLSVGCLALLCLGVILVPTAASAQAGFYVTPSFSAAEVYDDNVNSTPARRTEDLISRFTPGIDAGYRSVPLTLLGRYSFDSELYAHHPELNDAQVRQEATLGFKYLPTRPLTLSLDGSFLRTKTPGELNVATGLAAGRVTAHEYLVHPAIRYQFDALTFGTVGYSFTKDEIAGGISTKTHTARLGLNRRVGPLDTGSFGYDFTRYIFGGDGAVTSQVFTLGWTHEITPLTDFTLRAGPRVTEGKVRPEVSVAIHHTLRRGEVSFAYARSQATVLGEVGTVKTDSFTAGVVYQVLRFLRIRSSPSFIRTSSGGATAKVYTMNLDATYTLREWMSLLASYRYSLQQGSIAGGDEHIPHNLIMVGITLTYPQRVY